MQRMHTVDLLEQAIAAATRLGYQTRYEWLGGQGGGACEVHGKKWLFLDLAQSPQDQLAQVLEALRKEPQVPKLELGRELRGLLNLRKAA